MTPRIPPPTDDPKKPPVIIETGRDPVLDMFLEKIFKKMMVEYDFLSVVMYPDLKCRKNFVHDAWLIAKFTENFELKMAISKDPYFHISRDDIFHLIKTHDDEMIETMLRLSVNL